MTAFGREAMTGARPRAAKKRRARERGGGGGEGGEGGAAAEAAARRERRPAAAAGGMSWARAAGRVLAALLLAASALSAALLASGDALERGTRGECVEAPARAARRPPLPSSCPYRGARQGPLGLGAATPPLGSARSAQKRGSPELECLFLLRGGERVSAGRLALACWLPSLAPRARVSLVQWGVCGGTFRRHPPRTRARG